LRIFFEMDAQAPCEALAIAELLRLTDRLIVTEGEEALVVT